MMRRSFTLGMAAGWLCTACAGTRGRQRTEAPTPATTAPVAADTLAQGIVRAVGADPFPQIVLAQAAETGTQDVAIVGGLRGELGALQGAEVRVWGHPVPNPQALPPRAIEATGYEVLGINGARPEVGELFERDGALWLNGKSLVGAPEELKRAAGSKVWIVGRTEDGRLRVQLYGVIAPVR